MMKVSVRKVCLASVLIAQGALAQQSADGLIDQAGGEPLQASRSPSLGQLFPLSEALMVDFANKRVGINSLNPDTNLFVYGNQRIWWNGMLKDPLAPGTDWVGGGLQYSNLTYSRGWCADFTGFQSAGGALELNGQGGFDVTAAGTLFVKPDGRVGVGMQPVHQLDVKGVFRTNDTIVSDKPAGAPFLIASTDVSANLNADLLDGFHAEEFARLSDLEGLGGGGAVGSGSISNDHIANDAAVSGSKIVPSFGAQDVKTSGKLAIGSGNAMARLHVRDDNLGLVSGSQAASVLLEARDPRIVLLEDDSGGAAGIAFERSSRDAGTAVPMSSVTDTWNLEREPVAEGAALRLTHGVGGEPASAHTVFETDGTLSIGSGAPLTIAEGGLNQSTAAFSVSAGGALGLDSSANVRVVGATGVSIETQGALSLDGKEGLTIESDDEVSVVSRRALSIESEEPMSVSSNETLDLYGKDGVNVSVERESDKITMESNLVEIRRVSPGSAPILKVQGRAQAVEFVTSSDERLKENILTLEDARAQVRTLRGVSFNLKDYGSDRAAPRRLGFIAQEVRDVLPDAVHEDGEGYLAVNYQAVIPVLVEALKEQDAALDRQAELIESLAERIAQLEADHD